MRKQKPKENKTIDKDITDNLFPVLMLVIFILLLSFLTISIIHSVTVVEMVKVFFNTFKSIFYL
jgi:hypothetical protein